MSTPDAYREAAKGVFTRPMTKAPDHYHCPGVRCYWRIQFIPTCSRCGGATVKKDDCCDLTRSAE